MYYNALKEILEKKTIWVVVESGEWYYTAIEAFSTKEEAEHFVKNYPKKKDWYQYEVVEQSVGKAFEKFDEQTKTRVIREEAEIIAKEADFKLRVTIEQAIEKKYAEKLTPIKDALDHLIRRGV